MSAIRPNAAAFQQLTTASDGGSSLTIDLADDALRSAGALTAASRLFEPGKGARIPITKPVFNVPTSVAGFDIKPPKYKLNGTATFYDNGTTAMRDVPRGTTIVICGAGGCIERIVTDYGPSKAGGRLIDMYRPDFFAICGCGWWSGTTQVTVRVY